MPYQETYKYKELDDEVEEEIKQAMEEMKRNALQENIEMAKIKVKTRCRGHHSHCEE